MYIYYVHVKYIILYCTYIFCRNGTLILRAERIDLWIYEYLV